MTAALHAMRERGPMMRSRARFAMLIVGGRAPALAALLFTLLTGLILLGPVILTVHQIAQGGPLFCSMGGSSSGKRVAGAGLDSTTADRGGVPRPLGAG